MSQPTGARGRTSTAWDVGASRWSTLHGSDRHISVPGRAARGAGLRHLPTDLGDATDLGLEAYLGAGGGEDGEPGPRSSRSRKRSEVTDLNPQSMVLRHDCLSVPLPADDGRTSQVTAYLRRRQRVVSGSLERQSPYWRTDPGHAQRAGRAVSAVEEAAALERSVEPTLGQYDAVLDTSQASAGPSRARYPLLGRELDRMMASNQKTALLRLDRGASRTERALRARRAIAAGADAENGGTDGGQGEESAAGSPDESDTDAPQMFPHALEWTEQDEQRLRNDEFGWTYDRPREPGVPEPELLTALHYWAAQFYSERGLLYRFPLQHAALGSREREEREHLCRSHAEEQSGPREMEVGSDLWAFWAARSIGLSRTMLQALDGSALVALAVFLEEYTKELVRGVPPDDEIPEADLERALRHESRRHKRQRTAGEQGRTPEKEAGPEARDG